MKTRICLLIGILMLTYSNLISKEVKTEVSPSREASINVFTTPELYSLTLKWADEFGSKNPSLKINVLKSSENEISATLKNGNGIGFIADESFASVNKQPNWNMIVGRDVIVPVMNRKNPFRDQISRKGLTAEGIAQILENPEKQLWGIVAGNPQNIQDLAINYYTMNDVTINSDVAGFLKSNRPTPQAIKTADAQEMISAIQKDPNGFGFCRLIQVIDPQNQNLAENINLVPIDKNGNGRIDYMENIYENLQAFSRGIWIGKYPKSLTGNIYSVASSKPQDKAELAFLSWVLTDGQQYLSASGFSDLALIERKSQLDKINEPINLPVAPANGFSSVLKIILLAIFTLVLITIAADAVIRRIKAGKEAISTIHSTVTSVFDDNSVIVPKGLYFDKTHTWAFMKKDGTVKIGLDDFLQHITGRVTRIEMKKPGEKIKKGECLFTINQKGKQLKIYSPVSGTISTHNESLLKAAYLINDSPYTDGWIYTIEPTNWLLEIQFMNMAEKYQTWLKDEFMRLKDFFATTLRLTNPEYAMVTLQDGGAMKDNILEEFGPEVWDDFQTKFIDIASK